MSESARRTEGNGEGGRTPERASSEVRSAGGKPNELVQNGSKGSLLRLMLLVITVALALWAQWALDQRKHAPWSFVAYALAALLFAWVFRAQSWGPRVRRAAGDAAGQALKWHLLVPALVLGGLSFPLFEGNRFTPGGTLLWGSGLVLLWLAMRDKAYGGAGLLLRLRAGASREGIRVSWTALAVMGSVLIGAFYRFHLLNEIPREMGCDLPLIYEDVKLVLEGKYLVFFPIHPGREGLFFYLAAPFGRAMGLDHYSVKFASACIGVATIPVLYLLVRELFGREAGVYSAFFLAVSRWHVILSRSGLRGILMPVFVMLVMHGLVRAMRTGRRAWFFWTGCALGLGMYTYNAFIIMPFALIGFLAVHALVDRGRFLRRHWMDLLLLCLVALFVFIPLGRYAFDEPKMYIYRVATRITSLESQLPTQMPKVLLDNFRRAFLMFNYVGDTVFYSNVPFERQLGYVSGVLFILGLVYAIVRWRREENALIIAMLFFTLLPTVLSIAFPQEVPNATRASGTLAPVYVLVGGALALLRRGFFGLLPEGRHSRVVLGVRVSDTVDHHFARDFKLDARYLVLLVLVVLLASEARSVYPMYFDRYVEHLTARNYSITLDMARAIDDFTDDGESYVVVRPYWYDGNAVRAQLRVEEQNWRNEYGTLHRGTPPLNDLEGKAMFLLHPEDGHSMDVLRDVFPRGVALRHTNYDGDTAFITFYGER